MNRVVIPLEEVEFHPLSFVDPNARLFVWKGELYRGIADQAAPFYERLMRAGIVKRLIEKKLLVETQLTPFAMGDYPLVVKHRWLPFVSYPCEWCGEMLKAAALIVLDMAIELAYEGLTLQDAHPWNVLFDGGRPQYVDLGSIVAAPSARDWGAYEEFRSFFLNPLRVMARGQERVARFLLHDFAVGMSDTEMEVLTSGGPLRDVLKPVAKRLVKPLVPAVLRPRIKETYGRVRAALGRPGTAGARSRLDLLQAVRQDVGAISLPCDTTEWANYYDGEFPPFLPSNEWSAKHRSVYDVLSELKPRTLLDVGSNRGWYSQLAARLGSQVVAFDRDSAALTKLFLEAREQDLSILPLIVDFRNPTPGYGIGNEEIAPATQRLKCELVIALALVHHLAIRQGLRFDQIVRGLSLFADRWLLIEFIPADDRYVREWPGSVPSWYKFDEFQRTLQQHYREVRVLPSSPEPRVLLLCEK